MFFLISSFFSYDEAIKMLSQTEILAPVYYIVGGSKPGQGAVVTRDRTKTDNIMSLNITEGKQKMMFPVNFLLSSLSFITNSSS